MARRSAALVSLAVALAGCGGEIPVDGYPGDPVLVLSGELQWTETPGEVPPVQMVLQWQKGAAPSLQPALTGSDREAPFTLPGGTTLTSTTFAVHVYYPPTDEALQPWFDPDVRFARGNVAAVPYGFFDSMIDDAVRAKNALYGADVSDWFLFSYGGIPAGSVTAWWAGALDTGLSPGVHQLHVTPRCLTSQEVEDCVTTLATLGDGSMDPDAARALCAAPYRLTPATLDPVWRVGGLDVQLGTWGLPSPGACP